MSEDVRARDPWQMRADNPAKGIERNQEQKRKRYPGGDELERLMAALDQHADQQAADIFRICLLTGCRSGEAMARAGPTSIWCRDMDQAGVDHQAENRSRHPLSAPARQLLAELRRRPTAPWVFPADSSTGHRVTMQKAGWRSARPPGSGHPRPRPAAFLRLANW